MQMPPNTTLTQLVRDRKVVIKAIKEGKTYPTVEVASDELGLELETLVFLLNDNNRELGVKLNVLDEAGAIVRLCEELNTLRADVRQAAKALRVVDRLGNIEEDIRLLHIAHDIAVDKAAECAATAAKVAKETLGFKSLEKEIAMRREEMEKRFKQFLGGEIEERIEKLLDAKLSWLDQRVSLLENLAKDCGREGVSA